LYIRAANILFHTESTPQPTLLFKLAAIKPSIFGPSYTRRGKNSRKGGGGKDIDPLMAGTTKDMTVRGRRNTKAPNFNKKTSAHTYR